MKIGLVILGLNIVDNNAGAPGTWNKYVQDHLHGDYRKADLQNLTHCKQLEKVVTCLIPNTHKKYDTITFVDCRRIGDPDHDPALRSHRGTHPVTLKGFLRGRESSKVDVAQWFFNVVTE